MVLWLDTIGLSPPIDSSLSQLQRPRVDGFPFSSTNELQNWLPLRKTSRDSSTIDLAIPLPAWQPLRETAVAHDFLEKSHFDHSLSVQFWEYRSETDTHKWVTVSIPDRAVGL